MQKKKGISLIVLVITIVVMIILAGAIIISLNNTGVIKKANEAVEASDEAAVRELANMGWADAYLDDKTLSADKTNEWYEEYVKEYLNNQGITNEQLATYLINVTKKGVTVKLLTEAWVQDGVNLTRGEDKLTVGQTINYIATGTGYKGEWKVLGADDDGNLLIMSASNVATDFSLYTELTTLATAQSTWLSGGVNKLNDECAKYGKGQYAIGARSITVDDVNKVTKYDPETAGYGSGEIYAYKNQVTYYWDSDNLPAYKYTKADGKEVTRNLTSPHDKFVWYDEESKTFKESTKTANAANDALEEIATITSNFYNYVGASKLSEDSDAYKLLFGTSESYNYYWIASPYVNTGTNYVNFGMRYVYEGRVGSNGLFSSDGYTFIPSRGVRAVVTLQSSVPMSSLISQ